MPKGYLRADRDTADPGGRVVTHSDRAKALLVSQFTDWAPQLRALITEADGALIPRTINALPIGHRWTGYPVSRCSATRRT